MEEWRNSIIKDKWKSGENKRIKNKGNAILNAISVTLLPSLAI